MPSETTRSSLTKRILWILGLLIGIYLLCFFVLRIPVVQNRTVDIVERQLSKSIGTKLEIGRVDLKFFDFFHLKDVYLEDTEQDTFLFVENAFINFDFSLRDIANGRLEVEAIDLKHGMVRIVQLMDGCSNIEFKDRSDELSDTTLDGPKGFQILFRPSRLQLEDFTYENKKLIRGGRELIHIDKAKLWVDSSDFNRSFCFEKAQIDGARILIDKFAKSTIDTVPRCPKKKLIPDVKPALVIRANEVRIKNGVFLIENRLGKSYVLDDDVPYIDFNHFELGQMNCSLNNLFVENDTIRFDDITIDGVTPEGFRLEELSASTGIVNPQLMDFDNFLLQTERSLLRDHLKFRYRGYDDFGEFVDRIFMDCNLDRSQLAVGDLLAVAPRLYDNRLFVDFADEEILFDGELKGTVNNLIARGFEAYFGQLLSARGNLSMRSITRRDEAYLNLDLEEARAQAVDIMTYFPKPNWPAGFADLGGITFEGRFIGLLTDWVATCEINSSLGSGAFDIHINTLDELFEGDVALNEFDLGRFLDHDKFGFVTASLNVEEGSGFSLDKLDAYMEGSVECFDYNDYTYERGYINGHLRDKFFDGSARFEDENIDLVLDGQINLSDDNPQFDFKSSVNKVDLQALNLSSRPIMLKGDFDFNIKGKELDELNGKIALNQFVVNSGTNHEVEGALDSLVFEVSSSPDLSKHIRLYSEPIKANIDGQIDLKNIVSVFKNAVYETNPSFFGTVGLFKNRDSLKYSQLNDFVFDFDLRGGQPFLQALKPDIDSLTNWVGNGHYRSDSSGLRAIMLKTSFDHFAMQKYRVNNASIEMDMDDIMRVYGKLNTGEIYIGDLLFDQAELDYGLRQDALNYHINIAQVGSFMDSFFFDAIMTFEAPRVFTGHVDSSSFRSLGNDWSLQEGNSIKRSPYKLFVDQFVYSSDESNIYIQSVTDQSLIAGTRNLDAQFLNEIINNDNLKVGGEIYTNIGIENLFDTSGYEIDLSVENLKINNDIYDILEVNAYLIDVNSPAVISGGLTEGGIKRLDLSGEMDIGVVPGPSYDVRLDLNELPLASAEIFLGKLIDDTKGVMTSSLTFSGVADNYNLGGGIEINGSTIFNLLGTELVFDKQLVQFSKGKIDFRELEVSDGLGNLADVSGELTHNSFRDASIILTARSRDGFRVMNSQQKPGIPFYGTAFGQVDISLEGPLNAIDVVVNAESRSGTHVTLPITYYTSSGKDFFYTIIDSTNFGEVAKVYQEQSDFNPSGVDLKMELDVGPEATVEMIFGSNTDDHILGNGTGDLSLHLERSGRLTMYGLYEIESGVYNFAKLRDVGLIKPFNIESGGRIEWNGNPYEAELGIVAQYKTRTSPYNFVSDLITNENLQVEASNVTDVELLMSLSGVMSQPQIDFDFGFPNLGGQVKNLVLQKKTALENDPAEVSQQAYSLLVSGTFAPPNSVSNFGTAATNTVSDILTSYGSALVTTLLQQSFIYQLPFVTNFSVDFDAKNIEEGPSGQATDDGGFVNYLEGSASIEFKNRLNLIVIGSRDDRFGNSNEVLYEGAVEYYIRPDKTLKLHGAYEPTRYNTAGQIQQKIELGASFSKVFDRLGDIFRKRPKENEIQSAETSSAPQN